MVRWIVAIAVLASAPPAQADPAESKPRASNTDQRASKPTKKTTSTRRKSNVFSRHIETKRVYDGMPPGFSWPLTRAMGDASRDCEARLDVLGVTWKRATRAGHIADPIVITDMMLGGIKYTNVFGAKASSTMDCQLALALVAVGPDLYQLGVREAKFGGIYNWSYVRSFNGNVLSRHAIGVAMDINSFVDDTGRDVQVVKSYKQGEALLLAIEKLFVDGNLFHNVITPRNDPISHDNHFHVEAIVDFRAPAKPAF